jgi:hypothetical protein
VGQGTFTKGVLSGLEVRVDLTQMIDNSFVLIGNIVGDTYTGHWSWDGEGPSASGRFSAWRLTPPP